MSPATDVATADELAAFYLRGRDVQCPGCGYNRRDGLQAECPECATRFVLMPTQRQVVPLASRTARRLAWLLIVATGIGLFGMLFNFVRGLWLNGSIMLQVTPTHIWIAQGLYLVVIAVSCAFSIGFLVHLRARSTNENASPRRLITGVSILLVGIVLTNVHQMVLFLI